MALKPVDESLSASEKISAWYGGPEKARLLTFNHGYKEADAPPEPICRLYGHSISRTARYILLALFLGLTLQFWNGHSPSFRILDFARKADLPSENGKPNVEASASTFSQSALPCKSLVYILC